MLLNDVSVAGVELNQILKDFAWFMDVINAETFFDTDDYTNEFLTVYSLFLERPEKMRSMSFAEWHDEIY